MIPGGSTISKLNWQTDKNGKGTEKTNKVISKIINHYITDKDGYVAEKVLDAKGNRDGIAGTTGKDEPIIVDLDAKGSVDTYFDNFINLQSIIKHEKKHKEFDNFSKGNYNFGAYTEHVVIYESQLLDSNFKNTTPDFQKFVIESIEKNLEEMRIDIEADKNIYKVDTSAKQAIYEKLKERTSNEINGIK